MSRQGLFVGINTWGGGSGLEPLKYAEADARRLAAIFSREYGFTTRVLAGDEATRGKIEEGLLRCGKGEVFVFFFAGHGADIRGGFHLYPVNATAAGQNALHFNSNIAGIWRHDFGYGKVWRCSMPAVTNMRQRVPGGGAVG